MAFLIPVLTNIECGAVAFSFLIRGKWNGRHAGVLRSSNIEYVAMDGFLFPRPWFFSLPCPPLFVNYGVERHCVQIKRHALPFSPKRKAYFSILLILWSLIRSQLHTVFL